MPGAIPSTFAVPAVSRSRNTRHAITSRCRCGSRRSAVSRAGSSPASPAARSSTSWVPSQATSRCLSTPPRDPCVQRRAHDPPPRRGMAADLMPPRPGAGERLRHQVLGQLPVTHADQHGPQASCLIGPVELRELLLFHTRYTLEPPHPLTSARAERWFGLSGHAHRRFSRWAADVSSGSRTASGRAIRRVSSGFQTAGAVGRVVRLRPGRGHVWAACASRAAWSRCFCQSP